MSNYYIIDWRARSFQIFSTWADVQAYFVVEGISVYDMETQYMVIKGRDLDPI